MDHDARRRVPWDETVDVVVVGFGAAGAAAAIEAAARGASVLVIDRFEGGGSTKMSGGIVYAGGGTELQIRAGYEDSPEGMRRYLELESGRGIDPAALRAFCERSREDLEWLRDIGVPFAPSTKPVKASYPADDCTLYFSGNELATPYRHAARPAPRGHRPRGKGRTGAVLFRALRAAAERGAEVRIGCRARRLVVDREGGVLGVEFNELRGGPAILVLQRILLSLATVLGAVHRRSASIVQRWLDDLERFGSPRLVRARGGVVLATGGFVFNAEMLDRYAPRHSANSMRLGSAAEVGDGIALGTSVGGAVAQMDRCAALRFIDPPSALVGGLLLDRSGDRVCNEELCGASIGDALARPQHGGRGWLIVDAAQAIVARCQLRSETMDPFPRLFGRLNLSINRHRARTLETLGARCGMPPGALARAVRTYNEGVARGVDLGGKSPARLVPITRPPFYAINLDLDNVLFPTPTMTLGGLRTNGLSGHVLRNDGSPIAGLFAAGRAAAGISSHAYVSGLSLADCIFSGRNAGAEAAQCAAPQRLESPQAPPADSGFRSLLSPVPGAPAR